MYEFGEAKLSVYSRECTEEERSQSTLWNAAVYDSDLGNKETEKEHKWK